jgi:hypothetical protein
MKKLSILLAALVLSACGGSGGGVSSGGDVGTTPPPMTNPAVDAFFTRVQGFVATASETEEPGDITLVMMTEPEDTSPVEYQ